jgi:hypothetical protein
MYALEDVLLVFLHAGGICNSGLAGVVVVIIVGLSLK